MVMCAMLCLESVEQQVNLSARPQDVLRGPTAHVCLRSCFSACFLPARPVDPILKLLCLEAPARLKSVTTCSCGKGCKRWTKEAEGVLGTQWGSQWA